MINQEVVNYLRAHLGSFPLDDLRRQLAQEGISDIEFDEALKAVKDSAPTVPLPAEPRASRAGLVFLAAGVAIIIAVALVFVFKNPAAPPAAPQAQAPQTPAEEAGFIGHNGYVIRLPPGYTFLQTFKDDKKTDEVVHFFKKGTDPTQFADHDLYGQLGIVRLEVTPNPFAGSLTAIESLKAAASADAVKRNEKFHIVINNPQESKKCTLAGIELFVETPSPRLEAYYLGDKVLYNFTAGQDDEIYRAIIASLRETQASN